MLNQQRLYLIAAVAFAAFFLFANAGFRDLVNRTRDKRRLERQLVQLRSDHQTLSKEWAQIQQDPSYTEYLIRKYLGYVKKGEVEYQILKKEK
jgi:cell division protein FtsB